MLNMLNQVIVKMRNEKRVEYLETTKTIGLLSQACELYTPARQEVFSKARQLLIKASRAAMLLLHKSKHIDTHVTEIKVEEALPIINEAIEYLTNVYIPTRESVASHYNVSEDNLYVETLKGNYNEEEMSSKQRKLCPNLYDANASIEEWHAFFHYFLYSVFSDTKFQMFYDEYAKKLAKLQNELEEVSVLGKQLSISIAKI